MKVKNVLNENIKNLVFEVVLVYLGELKTSCKKVETFHFPVEMFFYDCSLYLVHTNYL